MRLGRPLSGNSSPRMLAKVFWQEAPMTYSFTQISQYLRCPRQYRYRYLDGWREREDRASMIFGRCLENALSAYFRREDPTAMLFKEWQQQQDASLAYTKNDSLGPVLSPGESPARTVCSGGSRSNPKPKTESSSEVDALASRWRRFRVV